MRILGLIPARGGSKGIPRKNLALFAGRSLLAWTCEAALEAEALDAVVLSTEDVEIAEAGRCLGVRVPFARPPALAADDTPSLDVVRHALDTLEATGETYDAVCLLQPTNPLRHAEDIDAACGLLESSEADAVVSVAAIPAHHHPLWAYAEGAEHCLQPFVEGPVIPRRQDLPPAWYREGSVYVTRSSVIRGPGGLYGDRVLGYRMPPERSGGIDTPGDLATLEARVRAGSS